MRRREADFATAEVQAAARHLGSLIRQARLARKWSQTLLAERARVSKPTLSRIEKGAVEPSIGLWLAVLEALGLSSILRDVRDPVPAGRLSLVEDGIRLQASRFAYGRRYIARSRAIAVDPVSLPLERDDDGIEHAPLNGLPMFGAIRDATPDCWGRRVSESRLDAPPNGLPESVYLDHAGANRVGALDVRASIDSMPSPGLLPAPSTSACARSKNTSRTSAAPRASVATVPACRHLSTRHGGALR